jgi:hypothetical protein
MRPGRSRAARARPPAAVFPLLLGQASPMLVVQRPYRRPRSRWSVSLPGLLPRAKWNLWSVWPGARNCAARSHWGPGSLWRLLEGPGHEVRRVRPRPTVPRGAQGQDALHRLPPGHTASMRALRRGAAAHGSLARRPDLQPLLRTCARNQGELPSLRAAAPAPPLPWRRSAGLRRVR